MATIGQTPVYISGIPVTLTGDEATVTLTGAVQPICGFDPQRQAVIVAQFPGTVGRVSFVNNVTVNSGIPLDGVGGLLILTAAQHPGLVCLPMWGIGTAGGKVTRIILTTTPLPAGS